MLGARGEGGGRRLREEPSHNVEQRNDETVPNDTDTYYETRCREEEIYLEEIVEIERDRFIAVDEVLSHRAAKVWTRIVNSKNLVQELNHPMFTQRKVRRKRCAWSG